MKKLKIVETNNYNYLLNTEEGEVFFINIDFIDVDKKPGVGDYIFLPDNILNNKNIYTYGKVINDINTKEEDMIKVIVDDQEIYLERYYG